MSARDCLKSINIDQWFETVDRSPLSLETHLPETVKNVRDEKEDRTNETHPLGCKENLVAPNRDNNNNNNNNITMLNKSIDDIEMNDYDTLHFDELFYHNELFT